MEYNKNLDELFSKVHQMCCIKYEKRKQSINYIKPIIEKLSDFGHIDSKIFLAEILIQEDIKNFNKAKSLYLYCIKNGNPYAMYNLYISYAEIGDKLNALKYFKMAKDSGFSPALEHKFLENWD